MQRNRNIIAGLTLSSALALVAFSASANEFSLGYSTCTVGFNCGAKARVHRAFHQRSNRWIGRFYAKQNECLRLDVVRASKDVDMAVIGPHLVDPAYGGHIWANDQDGEDGDFSTPRVVIDPVPRTGFYTVAIGEWDDVSGAPGNFDLYAMRYDSGNPVNCVNPNPSWGESNQEPVPLNAPAVR